MPPLPGDFNSNNVLEVDDIDLLSAEVRGGLHSKWFDLDDDGAVDESDHRAWVHELKNTWLGDANLDSEFDSGDLVAVFQAGEYEDGIHENSGWAEGDWNGDGDFTSGDLVVAFEDGGYGQGPRLEMNAVPEPTSLVLLVTALIGIAICRRRTVA